MANSKPAAAADYLNQVTLLRFIVALALVLSPHAARIPAWEVVLVVAVLAWRAVASLRQWALPHWTLRTALTLGAFAGIIVEFGTKPNQEWSMALLVAMAANKLLEMRSRRDVMVTVFLMYFILLTHFLVSQEIWTVAYLFVCSIVITALLVDVNHAGSALPTRVALSIGGRMIVLALPLMAILFVLFPRIPGPLWGLPTDSGASLSGISEEMSPGDISKLMQSEEVAFRVSFESAVPPPREQYWRGPVMSQFDGRTWYQDPAAFGRQRVSAQLKGAPVRYEVTLEPHRARWLFALDLPDATPGAIPPDAKVTNVGQLVAQRSVNERRAYTLRSHTQYLFQPELTAESRRDNTRLPKGYNPRAVELARSWRDQGMGDLDIVKAALARFRSENFRYTLEPPPLGRHSVDEFLFDTRQGFCEHYSSAFTVLMRAAGIPARVVAGYQGTEYNDVGGYYIVRQSLAHAWSEIWLPEQGWVRVDPTSAVAPERVENPSQALASESAGAFDLGDVRIWAEARWDWLNSQWNRWVLGFGPELQADLMKLIGIVDWGQMILLLTVLVTGVLALVNLGLLRQFAPAGQRDQAQRLWQRALKLLRKRGAFQQPGEGPRDFVARLAAEHPDLAAPMHEVLQAYLRLRYLEEPAPQTHKELAQAVGRLRTA